jgi:uncharacterized protein YndB with AHSA1/START domain
MAVLNVKKDFDALSVTITAEFDVDIARVWELWADPRKLELWWGPPSYPVTFVDYHFEPGGSASYYMTSPEGDRHHGWWRVVSLDAPSRFVFEDGYADENGHPNTEFPVTRNAVTLTQLSTKSTRMVIVTTFASREAMEQILETGFADVLTASVGHMGELLSERKDEP